METVSALIFSFGIVVSVLALIVALESYRKERGYWREDEAMMKGWLKKQDRIIKSQKETIDELQQKLVDNFNAHEAWVVVAKKNYKHLKRQIANRDGQITKLKKRIG